MEERGITKLWNAYAFEFVPSVFCDMEDYERAELRFDIQSFPAGAAVVVPRLDVMEIP